MDVAADLAHPNFLVETLEKALLQQDLLKLVIFALVLLLDPSDSVKKACYLFFALFGCS